MNIIIGKNGLIASYLAKIYENYYITSSNSKEKDCIYLNLNCPEKFDYSIIDRNTNVLFLAAISSPDECTKDYLSAYKINVIGTNFFIKKCIEKKAKVLFFSSDVVYGNTLNKVDENSFLNPFGKYAEMKIAVEREFLKENNFKVFRLSYVLSKEDKYLNYLQKCLDKNEIAEVFHPFNRKVIYIEDILSAVNNLLNRWDEFDNQIFNLCGEESISRKDIADFFNKTKDNKLKYSLITPSSDFWEARPKDINIISIYLEKLLKRKPTKICKAIQIIVNGGK